jgi:hypothetical protein
MSDKNATRAAVAQIDDIDRRLLGFDHEGVTAVESHVGQTGARMHNLLVEDNDAFGPSGLDIEFNYFDRPSSALGSGILSGLATNERRPTPPLTDC